MPPLYHSLDPITPSFFDLRPDGSMWDYAQSGSESLQGIERNGLGD